MLPSENAKLRGNREEGIFYTASLQVFGVRCISRRDGLEVESDKVLRARLACTLSAKDVESARPSSLASATVGGLVNPNSLTQNVTQPNPVTVRAQAAEEKRIKDEAVRLAGLAASLERETERLARQRAQAEKLERDMRERFGTVRAHRP